MALLGIVNIDYEGVGDARFEQLQETDGTPDVDIFEGQRTDLEEVLSEVVVGGRLGLGVERFEELLGEGGEVGEWVVGEEEGEGEGAQVGEGGGCGLVLEDGVELVDEGFEGGVEVDEGEEGEVFMLGLHIAIEQDVALHFKLYNCRRSNSKDKFITQVSHVPLG